MTGLEERLARGRRFGPPLTAACSVDEALDYLYASVKTTLLEAIADHGITVRVDPRTMPARPVDALCVWDTATMSQDLIVADDIDPMSQLRALLTAIEDSFLPPRLT